jgi:hypothetical protein
MLLQAVRMMSVYQITRLRREKFMLPYSRGSKLGIHGTKITWLLHYNNDDRSDYSEIAYPRFQ